MMRLPDGRPLVLDPGILAEPTLAEGRIIFWMPGETSERYRQWERIGNVPNAGVSVEAGICATAVSAVPARQRIGGGLGSFWNRLRGSKDERSWTLPGIGLLEQCGTRRADLLLVWAEDDSVAIDPERIRLRWREVRETWSIGPCLYLVSGIDPSQVKLDQNRSSESETGLPETSRSRAEQALVAARAVGDPRRSSMALADVGLACLQAGDLARGVELIEAALVEARRSGDRVQEIAVMIDQAVAALSLNQPARAREILEQASAWAREAGNPFLEKAAAYRLGQAFVSMNEHAAALGQFERALSLAANSGDRSYEPEILWNIGLQHAELGRRDRALAMAQAAVDRMRRLGQPKAEWYAHHLARFRSGETGSTDSGSVITLADSEPSPPDIGRGPGPLRMALTALSSMAKFVGTGFKRSPPETSQARLEVCHICDQHTGLRCLLCGCFTQAKARLLHERCPLGKWPS